MRFGLDNCNSLLDVVHLLPMCRVQAVVEAAAAMGRVTEAVQVTSMATDLSHHRNCVYILNFPLLDRWFIIGLLFCFIIGQLFT